MYAHIKTKKVYHANYDYYTYYDYYTIMIGIAQLNTFSCAKNGYRPLQNVKQQSLEFITPSNLNTFFMPITKAMFSWILDTNV